MIHIMQRVYSLTPYPRLTTLTYKPECPSTMDAYYQTQVMRHHIYSSRSTSARSYGIPSVDHRREMTPGPFVFVWSLLNEGRPQLVIPASNAIKFRIVEKE